MGDIDALLQLNMNKLYPAKTDNLEISKNSNAKS